MSPTASRHLLGLALAGLLATSAPASASGLQVAPTGLEFTPGGAAQALWLTNTGDSELRAQVRTFKWTQSGGKDELAPTRALVASPPMLTLAPGQRQLVRVIRAGQAATTGEQAFRLLVDELPAEAQQAGVQYVLRYSVPVFVTGPAPVADAQSALSWSIRPGSGALAIEVRNSAQRHVQLTRLDLLPANGTSVALVPGLLGYVLAGSTMHWSVNLPATDATRLRVQVNGAPVEQPLASSPTR